MGNESHIYDNAIQTITNGFREYLKRNVNNLKFDVTKNGRVVKVLANNKYLVRIQGTDYTVPCATGQTFKVNDNVLVLHVQNDAKRQYITGKGV